MIFGLVLNTPLRGKVSVCVNWKGVQIARKLYNLFKVFRSTTNQIAIKGLGASVRRCSSKFLKVLQYSPGKHLCWSLEFFRTVFFTEYLQRPLLGDSDAYLELYQTWTVNNFCKKFHLRCLARFWIRLWDSKFYWYEHMFKELISGEE